MSRIDASGRLTSQVISHVLNWQPGDRLTLTAGAGVVVARRDPHVMVTVPARHAVAIPAALRHRCGLRAGDRVLRMSAWTRYAAQVTGPGSSGSPARDCCDNRTLTSPESW